MTGTVIGYARVSTTEQNSTSQVDAIRQQGASKVFIDTYTGTKMSRPEFDKALDYLREGDLLVVTRLDRLGRSTKDLLSIAEQLKARGIGLKVVEQNIDTSSAEGRLFFTIVSAFAEFEHSLIVSRTKDGLAAARARGRTGGRKPKLSESQVREIKKMYAAGEKTVAEIASLFSTSRPTVYRALEVTPVQGGVGQMPSFQTRPQPSAPGGSLKPRQ
jgi:DNA invertase Pin-like site-specific DNA recombinase